MEPMKTAEDVINRIEKLEKPIDQSDVQFFNMFDAFAMLRILANEIKQLKVEVAKHKLLIEHEEAVRTTRASRKPAEKNVVPKFRKGDRICRVKEETKPGEVIKVRGNRVHVIFGDQAVWVEARSIQYYKRRAA